MLVAVLRQLNQPLVPQLPHRFPEVGSRGLPLKCRIVVVGNDSEQGPDAVSSQQREDTPEAPPVHCWGDVIHAEEVACVDHAALCR